MLNKSREGKKLEREQDHNLAPLNKISKVQPLLPEELTMKKLCASCFFLGLFILYHAEIDVHPRGGPNDSS